MESLQGQFLVASPHLSDGNFFHTVVLMIQHDDEGAFGVILNRPSRNSIAEIWKLVNETPIARTDPVNIGGPVAGPLIALHTDHDQGEAEVVPGVFFSSSPEHLANLLESAEGPLRLFVGYSGWGSGQLESEMSTGGWLSTPAVGDDVFADPDHLWDRMSRRIGWDILNSVIPGVDSPPDPSMN